MPSTSRAPGTGQALGHLRIDRLLHPRAGRADAGQPAADMEHLVGTRGMRALAPRRRLAHPVGQRAPAGVGAGRAAVIAQGGHRVDREQRGVDRRLRLSPDAVAAIGRVPQVVHTLGDRVDERPVAGLGQPGAHFPGACGARGREQAQRRRGERGARGEARAPGEEVAAGEGGGHALTVEHARARGQQPKGAASAPQVGDPATPATATSRPPSVAESTRGPGRARAFHPAGHATLTAHGRQLGRCVLS
jgi:hypothetical protein